MTHLADRVLLHNNKPTLNTELQNLPREKWKDIPGFTDLYHLSNYGRVKSLARWVERSTHRDYYRPERIIKLRITPSNKKRKHSSVDLQMKLHKDKKRYQFSVARYVYFMFVDKFNLGDHTVIITRKDNDKFNCFYKNLELRTISDVAKDGYITKKRKSIFQEQIKPVTQYSIDGKKIRRYSSTQKASEATEVPSQYINDAARIKVRPAGGFYWRYGIPKSAINVSIFKNRLIHSRRLAAKRVQQLSLQGKPLRTYDSVCQAAKAVGSVSSTSVSHACQGKQHTCTGFKWRYV